MGEDKFIIISILNGEARVDTTHPLMDQWSVLVQDVTKPASLKDRIPKTHEGLTWLQIARKIRERGEVKMKSGRIPMTAKQKKVWCALAPGIRSIFNGAEREKELRILSSIVRMGKKA